MYREYLNRNSNTFKPKTIEDYGYSADLLLSIVNDVEISEVNSLLIERKIKPYLFDNYAYYTVRHHLINFRSMFSKAVEWDLIPSNPFSRIVPKKKKRIPRYFKQDEIDLMRDYFDEPRIPNWQGEIVFFSMNTGLRKSELVNLRWVNVDLLNEQIIFSGKGDKERVVPLNGRAMLILRRRPRHIRNPHVFWEIKNAIAIDSMWKRLKKRTGIKGKFHDLRKTFASYYVMNGGSLEHLREILGHEDYETVKIYETLSPESLHKNKNIIDL